MSNKNIDDHSNRDTHPLAVADTSRGIDLTSSANLCRAIDPAPEFGDRSVIDARPLDVAEPNSSDLKRSDLRGMNVAGPDCGTGHVKMSDSDHVRHASSAPETGDHSKCEADPIIYDDRSLFVGDLSASVSRPNTGDQSSIALPLMSVAGSECADPVACDTPRHAVGTPDPATVQGEMSEKRLSPETNCVDLSSDASRGTHVGADEIDLSAVGDHPSHVDLVTLISDITVEHTRRQAAIKAQRRLDQAAGAMIRRLCGWNPELSESERMAINKQADRIFKALEKDKELALTEDEQIARLARPFVFASLQAREPFDLLRKNAEKTMADRGKQLPVWPWLNAIRGIDIGGLCAIIGEAGDLNNYSNPAKLWKRLGVGVLDGQRQGNPGKNATAEDWIKHGYSPRRRSIMWNVGYALVMVNGDGRYRTDYLKYKERLTAERSVEWVSLSADGGVTTEREAWSKGHIARAAQRHMEKLFLRDLWTVWRRATNK